MEDKQQLETWLEVCSKEIKYCQQRQDVAQKELLQAKNDESKAWEQWRETKEKLKQLSNLSSITVGESGMNCPACGFAYGSHDHQYFCVHFIGV